MHKNYINFSFIIDSSSDPLLDEHFRRSLGADYESLFKKKTSSDSESSSNESTPPKVPQMTREDSKDNTTKNNGDTSNTSKKNLEPTKEDSTQVTDPVKAFREDMEMEGYTGIDYWKINFFIVRSVRSTYRVHVFDPKHKSQLNPHKLLDFAYLGGFWYSKIDFFS